MTGKRRTTYRCTIMRGGTSKGIFLIEEDLPRDPELRDRIILAILGSPDIRQIDGLGGADSLTSKLALIGVSREPDHDIDYTFGAVGIAEPFVDYSANCGNISSAVGPFAIERRLVRPEEPFTTVRILNTNTRKMIHTKVPVKRGKVVSDGDYAIHGVPGTGAKIEVSFMDPGGTVTGKLIPTGNVMDEITTEGGERFRVSIVDAGNPTAFIQAEDLGLKGTELPDRFDQDTGTKMRLEAIRRRVGEMIGIPPSPSIPKIVWIAPPQDFRTTAMGEVKKEEIDISARAMAMGKMHKVFPITGAISSAAASVIPGSIVNQMTRESRREWLRRKLTIGHPSGKLEVEIEAKEERDTLCVLSCTIGRTARKIMEGRVYISRRVYSSVR